MMQDNTSSDMDVIKQKEIINTIILRWEMAGMEGKIIDLTKSVHDLCREEPAIINILAELGFTDITKPGMLQTVGRFMTITKGAALRHVDMELIRKTFAEHGYELTEGGHSYE